MNLRTRKRLLKTLRIEECVPIEESVPLCCPSRRRKGPDADSGPEETKPRQAGFWGNCIVGAVYKNGNEKPKVHNDTPFSPSHHNLAL